jgi:hypothetical protein
MSLQATPVHQSPEPLAKQLVNLKHRFMKGEITDDDIDQLIEQRPGSRITEQLQTFKYTHDVTCLEISSSLAFRAVVYQQDILIGVPVRYQGKLVPSPAPGDGNDLPIIYSRPLLFPLLTVRWQEDTVERYEHDGMTHERALHGDLELEWEGEMHDLLCETDKKSFYWPRTKSLPSEIQPWLTRMPQERTTLATGIKRMGHELDALKGIELSPRCVVSDGIWDLGVAVLPDVVMQRVCIELGIEVKVIQITIFFLDGSFFKGAAQSTTFSDMPAGFYGGVKRPHGVSDETASTRGSVMDAFELIPWSASLSRQTSDYAGLVLPVRAKLPSSATFMKATTGFPGYVKRLHQELISTAGRLFRKVEVAGYAGKVGIGRTDTPVQFIIRGAHVTDGMRTMALLFSPALPVHTKIMKVAVQCVTDPSIEKHLIQLNVSESNHDWIQTWWIEWAGRDNDGDGITLTTSSEVLDHAVKWTDVKRVDTTQFKSTKDTVADSNEEAIRTATERIRLYSKRIGIYDKLARRIVRQDPELMTWEIRLLLTEAIQRSISAQKKRSQAELFNGYQWLLEKLPEDAPDWIFHNVHDDIDEVSANVKLLLSEAINLPEQLEGNAYLTEVRKSLTAVAEAMPAHYQAATETLDLAMDLPKHEYHELKQRGRSVWATTQARSSHAVVDDVFAFIARSKRLWRSVASNDRKLNPGFGYLPAARIIRTWAQKLATRVNAKLLIGAMVNEFSLNLLGNVLAVEDLQLLGLRHGLYVPVATYKELKPGMVASKGAIAALLAHPRYLDALSDGSHYRIEAIHAMSGLGWLSRNSRRGKQSVKLLSLKEVK